MSRIGKKIIKVPTGTEIEIEGTRVKVKGPQGELVREFKDVVEIVKDEDGVKVNPKNESKFARSMWGTVSSHISNMIEGVNKKFEKKLIIEGVGYKASLSGSKIILSVGFSHDVELDIPEDIEVEIEKNKISVKGIDKEKVGLFASKIRITKKPEPYKGKGIRYENEVIRRKEGKRAV